MDAKIRIVAYAGVMAILGGGCSDADEPVGVLSVNPLEVTERIVDFHGHIDDVEVIPLITSDSLLVTHINKLLFTKKGDMIVMDGAHLYKFDKGGRFLLQYGNVGRGPGEYLKIYDICVDRNQTELWCLNHLNQVIVYDLHSAEYKRTIETHSKERSIPNASAIIPSEKDGFYLFVPNPPDETDVKEAFYCLKEFDGEGRFIGESLKRTDFNFSFNMFPFVTQTQGNKYLLRPQENEHICYAISENGITEYMKIHFGPDNIPPLYAYQNDKNPWQNLGKFMASNYYKLPFHILDTPKQLFFSAFSPRGQISYFLLDKRSMHGINWSNGNDSSVSPFFIVCSDEDSFYGIFDKYDIPEDVKTIDDPLLRNLITDKGVRLTENDNPKIIRIRFTAAG